MAELPSASNSLSDQSSAAPVGTDLVTIFSPCATNADGTPRLYSNVSALLTAHGYSEGADLAAIFMRDTKKPVLFVPQPIGVPGYIQRTESVHTGTSDVTAAVGGSGALAEVVGIVKVVKGGTIGTDQIQLSLSLDNGTTYKTVRLGTATSYVIPYIGVTLSFGAGTLVAGDTCFEFTTVAPTADETSLDVTGLPQMQAQQRVTRSWVFVGDQSSLTQVQAIETAANAYDTATHRFVYAKAQMRDRKVIESSRVRVAMVGGPAITFAEVGGTGDTITRGTGSFITDGFAVGDIIRVTGASTSQNNLASAKIASLSATVITLGADDLAAEVATAGAVAITAEPSFVFASGAHTITRSRGSWVTERFAVGDVVEVAGATNSGNNVASAIVSAVSATVLTLNLGGGDFTAETSGSCVVSVTSTESDSDWVASIDALVASVSSSPRMDLGAGRLTKLSPITGYTMRRPVQWADTVRSYQHDVKTATWQKDLGTLNGWGIDGEHDERIDGGLLAARFTCARTWENGPVGAFIAQSLTRAGDDSILSLTHNMAVSNVAETAVQRATENFVGRTIVLQPPDTLGRRFATPKSLAKLKTEVDKALAQNILANFGEGQRASQAYWTPATDDDLGVPNATLHGVTTLEENGTLVHINTEQQVS